MPKEDTIVVEGRITKVLPNTMFKVKLDNQDTYEIQCHLAGKLRMYNIRLLEGDRVRVELSPYDLKRGRIIYRLK